MAVKPAKKDATIAFLGGMMSLTVDVLPAKKAEETVRFTTIVPEDGEPTRPVQMYVHPDDLDAANPRMWPIGECEKAREVDGILVRVSAEEIAEVKEPLLPAGEMTVTVVPADQFDTQPNGALYRLRPKAQPAVYAAVVARVREDDDLAYITELQLRGAQRFYRVIAWNDGLYLQEHVRPGEFHETEAFPTDADPKLVETLGQAIRSQVEDFDPEGYVNFLRDRAAELDAAKRDPNAKPAPRKAAAPKVDDTAGLLAMLEGVAAAAKPKRATKAKKSA